MGGDGSSTQGRTRTGTDRTWKGGAGRGYGKGGVGVTPRLLTEKREVDPLHWDGGDGDGGGRGAEPLCSA